MPPVSSTALPHAQADPGGAGRKRKRPTEPRTPGATAQTPTATAQTPAAALWRIREYVRPYYRRLAFMIVAAVVAASAETFIPLVTKSVVDNAIAHGSRALLLPLSLAAFALGIVHAGLNFIRRWVQASAVTGMEQSIRDDLYAHLQRLEPGFHDAWQSGQLLSRATTDLSAIRRFAGFGVVFFITSTWSFALIIVLLIHLNWWLGLITGVAFFPVTLLCVKFEKRYRVLARRAQDQQGDLATYVEEAAVGIRVLKALGRRKEAAGQHRAQAEAVYRTQVAKASLRGTFWASLDLVPNAALGVLLLLGAIAVSQHALSIGGLVAFITLTLLLVWPIEAMGYIIAGGQEAATAAQRVYEIFDSSPKITERAIPAEREGPGARRGRRGEGGGLLVFDRVEFRYGDGSPVLREVSLEVQPGETVALVGPNGAGKSTLLQLVPRLADVTGGAVLLDGVDVRAMPLAMLRGMVACAFEEATLFSASVRENVSYGAPNVSDDEVRLALDVAAADFVDDLPWGLDTRIGEQGMTLSGGQRQRLALARAIITRPRFLLLDDPSSALDVHTEAKVTRALHRVLAETTALVVAHRPSTVALADRVALLRGGVIAAVGTHHDLLQREPDYRDLMSGRTDGGDLGGGLSGIGVSQPGRRP